MLRWEHHKQPENSRVCSGFLMSAVTFITSSPNLIKLEELPCGLLVVCTRVVNFCNFYNNHLAQMKRGFWRTFSLLFGMFASRSIAGGLSIVLFLEEQNCRLAVIDCLTKACYILQIFLALQSWLTNYLIF